MRQSLLKSLFAAFLLVFVTSMAFSQGVSTSSMTGRVTDNTGETLPGANVVATHVPSGTRYGAVTNIEGRYTIPGMRVGGPYTVTVSFIGFESQSVENVYLSLGIAANVNVIMRDDDAELAEVVILGEKNSVFSSDRTGATTAIGNDQINRLPTISRRIDDFTRLTPQASGNSFAGQDSRLNNITIDGSYFNNSFGLGSQPGDRTGVSPVSLDAIEQISVNVAPYDVRQGNFTGAGVNTVTRSGTNEFSGSAYYLWRNQNNVGTQAGENTFNPGEFNYSQLGFRLGGPIIKDKLFFFASFEDENTTEPGTTFRANNGNEDAAGNVTRVLASDLDQLSNFLNTNFGYQTGPYQGYDHNTAATKYLIKLDYNINDKNKFSLRYNHLDSSTDVLLSNSSSLGFGGRRSNLNGLNFQNSNYIILENIRSIVGELNSRLRDNMTNNLIIGYTYQDESRDSRGTFFPMVDILKDNAVYTTFGFEPFTPNNELRYKTFQIQNNLQIFKGKNAMTFGFSYENYQSENVFFPGSQSAYVYNSLEDFYADANAFLAGTTPNTELRRFQVRYSNVPGQVKPLQPLEVNYAGIYGQNEWTASEQFSLTYGLRIDVPFFGNTALRNTEVEGLNFRNPAGENVSFRTDKLPDANILWSPRVGFNWDLSGDRTTQIRGGSGIFTGRPAYVWISNQVGNNGILTGFDRLDNTTDRPFNPNPDAYKPATVTGAPAERYELALTEPDFKFPQVWRTNIALDQRLPYGIIGTAEFIYNADVNGVNYYNANLAAPNFRFGGADPRPRWVGGNSATRINQKIDNAVTLNNQAIGNSWVASISLEKPFANGLYVKAAYSYGEAKNTVDAGSIAFGSWNNNPHNGDPNNPTLGFSANTMGHRAFTAISYNKNFFKFGNTSFSLFWEGRTQGNYSYVYGGDFNGDGGFSNDLIYIHKNKGEMIFQEFTSSGRTFTAAEQADAWEAFIQQDKYLSANRGKVATRGAAFLPMVYRADFSFAQQLFTDLGGKKNTLEFRIDILNVGNLLNNNWGGGNFVTSTSPLIPAGTNSGGVPQFRLRNFGDQLISTTFQPTANPVDVWRMQFGLRYIFN
ncbi:TonB-dependent receptor [Shivajiella indica]|uniref:Carboxypeptidase regulatory-like domain-containing protein n=1 Tax=Shivajiella indica TaxID=872115 RepID=A0ABW5B1P2_9BACT